jgi:hypothetical protein
VVEQMGNQLDRKQRIIAARRTMLDLERSRRTSPQH